MPQSYCDLVTHFVFSTKNRENFITRDLGPRLYAYIGGIARQHKCILLAAGGMPDHLHLLVGVHQTMSASDLMRVVKANSSGWIHDTIPNMSDFAWQKGFGAFSFGRSQVPDVERYINTQEEHHKATSFQDEFLHMLNQRGIEYDERYVWD